MEVRTIVINFAIVGLFAFLLIAFAVNSAIDNNSNQSVLNDKTINSTYGSLNSSLSGAGASAKTFQNSLEAQGKNTNLFTLFGLIVLNVIPSMGIALLTSTINIYNATLGLVLNSIFGGDSVLSTIIFSVITFTFIVTFILLLWRLYRNAQ